MRRSTKHDDTLFRYVDDDGRPTSAPEAMLVLAIAGWCARWQAANLETLLRGESGWISTREDGTYLDGVNPGIVCQIARDLAPLSLEIAEATANALRDLIDAGRNLESDPCWPAAAALLEELW